MSEPCPHGYYNYCAICAERDAEPANVGDLFEYRGRVWRTLEVRPSARALVARAKDGPELITVYLDTVCLVRL